MKIIYIIAVALGLSFNASSQINSNQAIRAVVGEAAGEPYEAQVAVCAVIRNRGSLKGIYGLNAAHVDKEPGWVFNKVSKAWAESENHDPTNGCDMFGGSMDDSYFAKLGLKPVMTIGHTRFYKSKKKS